MKNIVTRSLSGIVYVGLIASALIAGPDWFMALCTFMAFLAVLEFHKLTAPSLQFSPARLFALTLDIAAAAGLCVATAFQPMGFEASVVYILTAYSVARLTAALYDKSPDAFNSAVRSIFSTVYIALPLALAAWIDRTASDVPVLRHLVLIVFIMIWLNDTGAYCVGCTLGRHKMSPRLSPKKSWEGFWGGMAFAAGAGIACGIARVDASGDTVGVMDSLWFWIALGAITSVFSTWGDLFESLIKRSLGVKDSGRLIPGHGGILDRIDSLLFVIPAVFCYLLLIKAI